MTALKELLKWWDEQLPDCYKSPEGYAVIEKAIELLEKEKQQIIDAYDWGISDKEYSDLISYENGTKYFEDTYE